jgi:hypothetical protein
MTWIKPVGCVNYSLQINLSKRLYGRLKRGYSVVSFKATHVLD